MDFMNICKERYATKKFDGKEIPQDKVDQLLEMIRLAPTSFGLQPFKIMVVTDQDTKEKLLPHSMNQEQVTTCSHLLVFCADTDIKPRIDGYEKMMLDAGVPKEKVEGYIGLMRGWLSHMPEENKLPWAERQAYIALGNGMNGAKALGFDSCPMEGFTPKEYTKILELPEHLVPVVLLPIGNAADEPKPKLRFPKDQMFF